MSSWQPSLGDWVVTPHRLGSQAIQVVGVGPSTRLGYSVWMLPVERADSMTREEASARNPGSRWLASFTGRRVLVYTAHSLRPATQDEIRTAQLSQLAEAGL